MKKVVFLALTIILAFSSKAQELCNVHQIKEIIDPETYQSVPISFQVFNLLMKHFEEKDFISWDLEDKKYKVYYKGKLIPDWGYEDKDEGKRFMVKYSQSGNKDNPGIYFKSSIPTGSGEALVYELNKNQGMDGMVVKKYHTIEGEKSGKYIEQTCEGTLILKGEYCLIDTLFRDTVTTFSPETYEEMVAVTEHHAISHRSGKWKYYNEKGEFLRKEKYRSCKKSKNKTEMNKQPNEEGVITGQLIEKGFTNKVGKSGGFSELYLRCSVQDYFIKLCECEVYKKDLLPYLDKGISVKANIVEFGEWDICPGDNKNMQSRIGSYIVIHEILD